MSSPRISRASTRDRPACRSRAELSYLNLLDTAWCGEKLQTCQGTKSSDKSRPFAFDGQIQHFQPGEQNEELGARCCFPPTSFSARRVPGRAAARCAAAVCSASCPNGPVLQLRRQFDHLRSRAKREWRLGRGRRRLACLHRSRLRFCRPEFSLEGAIPLQV